MESIERFITETLSSISLLVKSNQYTQALILLYSAIDTMAWLERGEGDVARDDFLNWVNRYMFNNVNSPITALDLYAARCGLLHSHSAESRLSRSGSARQIWYYTGGNFNEQLQKVLEDHPNFNQSDIVSIRFADLVAVFADGAMNFLTIVRTDENLKRVLKARVQTWLYWYSPRVE